MEATRTADVSTAASLGLKTRQDLIARQPHFHFLPTPTTIDWITPGHVNAYTDNDIIVIIIHSSNRLRLSPFAVA